MNLQAVIGLLDYLAGNFTQLKPDEKMAAAWAITLADQDHGAILSAAAQYVRAGHEFPPNPGTLIQLASRSGERLRGTDAWAEVREAITVHGYMGRPQFSDPKIDHCVRMLGGWYSVSTQLSSDVAPNRARFIEAFDNLSERKAAELNRIDTEEALAQIEDSTLRILGMPRLKELYGENYSDDQDPDDEH